MTLREYLDREKLSDSAFSRLSGVERSVISRAAAGATVPQGDNMRRIVAATAGAVTPNDFYGVGEAEPPAKAAAGGG